MACPLPDVRRPTPGRRGSKLRAKPRRSRSIRERQARGRPDGRTRVNPWLMPRNAEPRIDGWLWRGARAGRWEAADAGRRATPVRVSTVVLGVEGAPSPVVARVCETR